VILVGKERERQVVLLLEVSLLLYRVRTVAKDDCIESLEPRDGVAERARFLGSTRRVGFRVEVEHDPMAAVIAQRSLLPFIREDGEVRSR
jgi:hypothetical protein